MTKADAWRYKENIAISAIVTQIIKDKILAFISLELSQNNIT